MQGSSGDSGTTHHTPSDFQQQVPWTSKCCPDRNIQEHVACISKTLEQFGGDRLPDEEIVRRVIAGDTGLFELLIRRHDQRVYRAARAILKNETDAEDVAQEVYLHAFQHLSQFQGRAKFSTWLLKIAVREALSRFRRNARFEDLDEIGESEAIGTDPARGPEQMAARSEMRETVQRTIDQLPATLRAVLMLREIEGLSTAEAAEVLGISEDNLKVRLHRARAALREKLVELAGEQGPHLFLFEAPRCERLVQRIFEQIQHLARHPKGSEAQGLSESERRPTRRSS